MPSQTAEPQNAGAGDALAQDMKEKLHVSKDDHGHRGRTMHNHGKQNHLHPENHRKLSVDDADWRSPSPVSDGLA